MVCLWCVINILENRFHLYKNYICTSPPSKKNINIKFELIIVILFIVWSSCKSNCAARLFFLIKCMYYVFRNRHKGTC
jgi:hypothetical protein